MQIARHSELFLLALLKPPGALPGRLILVSLLLFGCSDPEIDPQTGSQVSSQVSPQVDSSTDGDADVVVDAASGENAVAASDMAPGANPLSDTGQTSDPTTAAPGTSPASPTAAPTAAPAAGGLFDSPEPSAGTEGSSPPTVQGAPVHDCESALPCQASTRDGAVTVIISAADGAALDGGGALRIDLAVLASTRDTTVAIEPASTINSDGQVLSIAALAFGGSTPAGIQDEAHAALTAGLPVNGHLLFNAAPAGNPATLDRLTLALSELGIDQSIAFADIPYGPETTPAVDCEDRLPCQWQTVDGDVTLTLRSLARLYWNRGHRTAIDWSFSVTTPTVLVALPGGRAIARSGDSMEIYGRELAGIESREETPLIHSVSPAEPIDGRLVLRRPPDEEAPGLARLELPLQQELALRRPRWRPTFLNVPLSP